MCSVRSTPALPSSQVRLIPVLSKLLAYPGPLHRMLRLHKSIVPYVAEAVFVQALGPRNAGCLGPGDLSERLLVFALGSLLTNLTWHVGHTA